MEFKTLCADCCMCCFIDEGLFKFKKQGFPQVFQNMGGSSPQNLKEGVSVNKLGLKMTFFKSRLTSWKNASEEIHLIKLSVVSLHVCNF